MEAIMERGIASAARCLPGAGMYVNRQKRTREIKGDCLEVNQDIVHVACAR